MFPSLIPPAYVFVLQVTAAHEKQATKDKFWRRDSEFIAADDESEEESASDGGGSDECLEGNERARGPIEVI